jgi:thiosulfate reductase cytochrome b subunit
VLAVGALLLAGGLTSGLWRADAAVSSQALDQVDGPPIHPAFAFLDSRGENVLESAEPVSTLTTCGQCHDTAFIQEHSYHADLGRGELVDAGEVEGGRPWDLGPGTFGRWNPLTYRYLSPQGDERIDLTTVEWLMSLGVRHAGGGPATLARDGTPLEELTPDARNVEAAIVDGATGQVAPWDWRASGTVEMNCFLCHIAAPDNGARIEALETGAFRWASTATLAGTDAVARAGDGWAWNPDAFDESGMIDPATIGIRDPQADNCGVCHGLVHVEAGTPLVSDTCAPHSWTTITTGEIFSPQRIADSGLNLPDKHSLGRSWDIHAERVLGCTDCHYSLNNPVYYQEPAADRPDHLIFDPRRIDLGDYLYRPLHEFAKGRSDQSLSAPELDDTLRSCESCHTMEGTHEWLPYSDLHAEVLACETCHVPQLYAPARQYVDWTVLEGDATPVTGCRGVDPATAEEALPLIDGYQPALLPRRGIDGSAELAPYNLITAWYWVYGDPPRPVPLRDLQAVWLAQEGYPTEILEVFDSDGDGSLSTAELVIDSDAKMALIASRLEALGLSDPRIVGDVQPYGVHHAVASDEWAVRECQTCHAEGSRVTEAFALSDRIPGGVIPTLLSGPAAAPSGEVISDGAGGLVYRPATVEGEPRFYVLGHDAVRWVDGLGAAVFLGVFVGAGVHGGIRIHGARRRPRLGAEVQPVYMYSVYERLWHWLQTVTILLLVFTGLVIHKPGTFGVFSFRHIVQVHNILAAILVVNAALAAFYHLASGEIRQFLPRPYGFFDAMFLQARYYLRGIFRGELHPFEKTPKMKMNPLQQVTYLVILNVLLPLQVITGLLMWGRQQWPELAARFGGLGFLGPFHTLLAWLFASFIVLHVYLTTTGPTPLSSIRGMVLGWDKVEIHPLGEGEDEGEETT